MNSRTYIRSFQSMVFENNIIIQSVTFLKTLLGHDSRKYKYNRYKKYEDNKHTLAAQSILNTVDKQKINFLE